MSELDLTSVGNWSWRAGGIMFNFLYPCNEAAPFYKHFGRGGTISLLVLERSPEFIGYLREEASFYWVNLGGSLVNYFLFMSETKLKVGWSFILWSMLYLDGWFCESSYWNGLKPMVLGSPNGLELCAVRISGPDEILTECYGFEHFLTSTQLCQLI